MRLTRAEQTQSLLQSEAYALLLVRMPHIAKSVELFWGTTDLTKYLFNVLLDSREGTRQGLPWEVASALSSLVSLHDVYWPQHAQPWEN